VLKQEHPSSEGTWNARGRQSRPGNEIESQIRESGDACVLWRRPLAIYNRHFTGAGLVQEDRYLPTRTIHVRLGYLEN
jgi:hypothetical protein